MTRDKSNHSVLITVSLALLISIAVPTSVCSRTSPANSPSRRIDLKPPSLLLSPSHLLSSSCQGSPVSSSITTLFSMWSPTPVHQPCAPCCLLSPPCPSSPPCVSQPSPVRSPWKQLLTWEQPHHLDQTLVPLYTSLKTKPTSSTSPSFPAAPPSPSHAVNHHHLTQQL